MKALLTTLSLVMTLVFQALSAPVNLDGDFVPDIAKSIAWMIEVAHPAVVGEGNIERNKKAAYSDDPLIHHWVDGRLEVEITADWRMPYTGEWIELSPKSFKSIQPKDKNNTELITTITIQNADNYYLEITVNGRITREYFTPKASVKKTKGKKR